jgi:hypothetical protein
MDDDDTVESFSIKSDAFLVLVKQTPGKPKPQVKASFFPFRKLLFIFIIMVEEETETGI